MIYLDNAATTYPKPEEVYIVMDRTSRAAAFNAGRGSYKKAQEAMGIIDDTRLRLKSLFNAEDCDVIFSPSITHAMNQVIGGLGFKEGDTVYVSPYEHNAVARTLHMFQKANSFSIEILPLDDNLRIDLDRTLFLFKKNPPVAVFINAVSNVTGYILPVSEMCEIAKENGAVTIVDAAQAAGLIEIDLRYSSSIDILCFAGHKTLQGPFGIGGFVIRHGIDLHPVFAGGTGSNSLELEMPNGFPSRFEVSSQNIPAIAGLNAALKVLDQKKHFAHVSRITSYLIERLREIEKVEITGNYDNSEVIGIVSFTVDGYMSDEIGMILDDEFDIAVRTGFHCAPFIHEYLNDISSGGTVRVGIGAFNTKEEIDTLIEALSTL